MKFLETSNFYSLNKSTYINLRWISYAGQLTAILIVEFFLKFEFSNETTLIQKKSFLAILEQKA